MAPDARAPRAPEASRLGLVLRAAGGDAVSSPAPEASARTRRLLLVLVAALFLVHAMSVYGEIIDDAYIAFRYARNLTHGHGLVFNPGERVEGFTSFSWVVLAAAAVAAHVSPVAVSVLVGASAGVGLVVLAAYARRALDADAGRSTVGAGLLAAALLAASADLAHDSVTGLETAAFALLFDAALVALVRRRATAFGALSALAFLTRPEAGLLAALGVVLIALGPRDVETTAKRRATDAARAGGVLAAVAVPFVLLKWSYFGAILPNTLRAKTPDPAAGLRYVLGGVEPAIGLVLLALAGAWLTRRRRAEIELLAGWALVVASAALEGGDWMSGHRFLLHGLLPLAVVAERGARAVAERIGAPRAAVVGAVAFCAAATPLAIRTMTEDREHRVRSEFWSVVDRDRARAVRAMTAAGVRSIATFDIGLVGWTAEDAVIVDLGGLTDRTIGACPGGYYEKEPPIPYLRERAPDAFLFASNIPPLVDPTHHRVMIPSGHPAEDHVKGTPWFRSRYAYRKTFALGGMGTQFLHWFDARRAPATP
jgi:hypothetical protein